MGIENNRISSHAAVQLQHKTTYFEGDEIPDVQIS